MRHAADFTADQGITGLLVRSDGDIGLAARQICEVVADDQLRLDARMGSAEPAKSRRHIESGEIFRDGDAHRAESVGAAGLYVGGSTLQQAFEIASRGQQRGGGRQQPPAAALALDDRGIHARLEQIDPAIDRGDVDAERDGRCGGAAATGDSQQRLQQMRIEAGAHFARVPIQFAILPILAQSGLC